MRVALFCLLVVAPLSACNAGRSAMNGAQKFQSGLGTAASTSATRSFTAATKRRSVVLTRRTPTTSAARNFSAYPTSAPLSLATQSVTATASQVIAQTITSPSTLNVGSYSGNYEVARTGAGLTTGIYGWVGQYFTGSSYEISQVFLGFDLSAVPNREITKAELRFTVNEAYGVNTVEARLHDWQDANSFVAGADLASKPLLGSTSVSAGQTGAKVISLTGVTRSSLLKIVLAGADQRTGTPPVGDDTTLLLSAGASLYLELVTRYSRSMPWLRRSLRTSKSHAPRLTRVSLPHTSQRHLQPRLPYRVG